MDKEVSNFLAAERDRMEAAENREPLSTAVDEHLSKRSNAMSAAQEEQNHELACTAIADAGKYVSERSKALPAATDGERSNELPAAK